MFLVQNTLISEAILESRFVCDLNACKGACCIEGDSGAPLEKEDIKNIEQEYHIISEFITEKGREAISRQGHFVKCAEDEFETPLIDNGPCAYINYHNNGIAYCGIEKAFASKKIKNNKPISCHLYPIRLQKTPDNMVALNYHQWEICSPACDLGKRLKIPVFRFLKQALLRCFGKSWFKELELIYKVYKEDKT